MRGGGRGRGGRGARGGRGSAASLDSIVSEEVPPAPNAVTIVDASSSSADLPQLQSAQSVVVVVPQGRMITRSLLRGASSLLLSDTDESPRSGSAASSSLAKAGERRKRANLTTVGTPLSPRLGTTQLSATPVSSLPTLGSLVNSPAIAPLPSSSSQRVVIGGLLRCVCDAFLVSPSETLLECSRCRNWCHPACVGVDVEDLRLYQQRRRSFVCPFCAPQGQPAEAAAAPQSLSPSSLSTWLSEDGRGRDSADAASRKATYADAFPAAPPRQPSLPPRQQTSLTTALGECIPVECSPSSPGPPLLSNTFAGNGVTGDASARAFAESDNDSQTTMMTTAAAAASPIIAGVTTASSVFPLASRQSPAPRQLPQKLRDVPDVRPPEALAQRLEGLLCALSRTAEELGYRVLHLPAHQLTEAQMAESLACCTEAIREATFSADYPAYCLKEVQQHRHPYVQGTALQSIDSGVVCAFVLSNGRDVYGNMRSTITQMKSALHRGFLYPADVTDFMAHCMTITDVSDMVHITLSATHARYQRKGLARLLMAMELLKWALRGRTRAFLNMAIEKRLVDGGTRIELASPAASRHLYQSFGFVDVFPRYDPVTKKERWTAKEADMGRVMANLRFVDDVQRVAAALPAKYQPPRSTTTNGTGSSESRASVTATVDGLESTPEEGRTEEGRGASRSDAAVGSDSARTRRRSQPLDASGVGRSAPKRQRSGSPARNDSAGPEAEQRMGGALSNGLNRAAEDNPPRRRLSLSH